MAPQLGGALRLRLPTGGLGPGRAGRPAVSLSGPVSGPSPGSLGPDRLHPSRRQAAGLVSLQKHTPRT